MGVAMSLFIEYVRFPNQPEKFGFFAKLQPIKIRELWHLLGTGDGEVVSAPVFAPRGVPVDVDSSILNKYADLLDERTFSMWPEHIQKRTQYIQRYSQTWASEPDHYDASWLTASELETVCDQFDSYNGQEPFLVEYQSIVAMLKILNQGVDENSRIVFWFW